MKLAIALALCTACAPNLKVPSDSLIQCKTTADCPIGMQCRQSVGTCVAAANENDPGPTLVSAQVAPSVAKAGSEVTATFITNAALGAAAHVYLAGVAGSNFTASGDATAGFTARYQVRGTEGEGQQTISADLLDVFGNASTVTLGTVIFDFTPPHVLSASASDASTLVLSLSEPVAAPVGTSVFSISPALAVLAFSLSSDGQTITLVTATQSPAHSYTLTLALADLAGNTMPAGTSVAFTGFGVAADATPPDVLAPKNGAVVPAANVLFAWTARNQATSYTVEIAEDIGASDDFTTNAIAGSPFTVAVPATSLVQTLPDAKTYKWRVHADTTTAGDDSSATFDATDANVYVYCATDPCADAGTAGNKTNPHQTLAGALADAQSSGRTQVLAASRPTNLAYVGAFDLVQGVNVLGGYTSDFTSRDVVANRSKLGAPTTQPATVRAFGLGDASRPTLVEGFSIAAPAADTAVAVDVNESNHSLTFRNCDITGTTDAPAAVQLEVAGGALDDGPLFDTVTIVAADGVSGSSTAVASSNSYPVFTTASITAGAASNGKSLVISVAGGEPHLVDSTVTASAAETYSAAVMGNGNIVLDNDTLNSSSTTLDDSLGIWLDNGTTVMNGGSITTGATAARNNYGLETLAGGVYQLTNVIVTVGGAGALKTAAGLWNVGGGATSITGSTITLVGTSYGAYGVSVSTTSATTITASTITSGAVANGVSAGLFASITKTVATTITVSGSTISGGMGAGGIPDSNGSSGIYLLDSNIALSVTDSTIQGVSHLAGPSYGIYHGSLNGGDLVDSIVHSTISGGNGSEGSFGYYRDFTTTPASSTVYARIESSTISAATTTSLAINVPSVAIYYASTCTNCQTQTVSNVIVSGATTSNSNCPSYGIEFSGGVGVGSAIVGNTVVAGAAGSGNTSAAVVGAGFGAFYADNIFATRGGSTRYCVNHSATAGQYPSSFQNNIAVDCPSALYCGSSACYTSVADLNDASEVTNTTGPAAGNLAPANIAALELEDEAANDFHLQVSSPSPAANAGINTTQAQCGTGGTQSCAGASSDGSGNAYDRDRVVRSSVAGFSIGAYEPQ